MAEVAASPPLTRRGRLLRALGVTPLRLRADDRRSAVVDGPMTAGALSGQPLPACVVLLPQASEPRLRDLVDRGLRAFGAQLARAPRVIVAAGQPQQPVPAAAVYLVFGQPQAQALGRALPAAQVNAAQVLLLDEPEQLLGAAGKRQLWQVLKRARRTLAAGSGPAQG